MMYLRAWIVDGSVAHVHCSDRPINRSVLDIDGAEAIVSAKARGDYAPADDVLPKLKWDGAKLSGAGIVDQWHVAAEE